MYIYIYVYVYIYIYVYICICIHVYVCLEVDVIVPAVVEGVGQDALPPLAISPKPSGDTTPCQVTLDILHVKSLRSSYKESYPQRPLLADPTHSGGNPGANRWFLGSTPIQMPPESIGICGRLT